MKKKGIYFVFLTVAVFSITLFALRHQRYMTPDQEAKIFVLANRYVEAFCHHPAELLRIFEGSFLPLSLLNTSKSFLGEMLKVEGPCFGHSKEDLQENVLYEIRNLSRNILRDNLGSGFGVRDFYDCLVRVERDFEEIPAATREIFYCVEQHLDIREIWYQILTNKAHHDPDDPDYFESFPKPIIAPVPLPGPVPFPDLIEPSPPPID